MSPCFAKSIALRVSAYASPSSKVSAAIVALLRAPPGRPWGLPLCPGWNVMDFPPNEVSRGLSL